MTIKWVKVDPLVMNGEPFCYATRLTVRNMLEMRSNGLTPDEMLARSTRAAARRHCRGVQVRVREQGALRGVLREGRRTARARLQR